MLLSKLFVNGPGEDLLQIKILIVWDLGFQKHAIRHLFFLNQTSFIQRMIEELNLISNNS